MLPVGVKVASVCEEDTFPAFFPVLKKLFAATFDFSWVVFERAV